MTASASAQAADADALFREGARLMDAGRLEEACAAFEASNRIDSRAGTLIRLGDCREERGQLASAWSAFSDAKARAVDPRKRDLAARRLAALESRVSHLTIVVPRSHRVEGLVVTRNGEPVRDDLWDRKLPVDGGKWRIVAMAPGHDRWSAVVVVPREKGSLRVEVPQLIVLPARTDSPAPVATVAVVERPRPGRPSRRYVAVGLVGAGALIGTAATALGVQARGLEEDAADMCPERQCMHYQEANALVERARDRARYANIGYALAGAAIGGGVVLWVTSRGERLTVEPIGAGDGAGASVRGRF